jgi:hypothetical protein
MKLLVALGVMLVSLSSLALDREAFTFTKYDLDVHIEPEQQRLTVRGTVTVRNDSKNPQKNVALQISSSLTWRSIQVNGKPVQFVSQPYTSDIDHTGVLSEAIVNLPADIPIDGTIELAVGYEGVVPLDATRLVRIGIPKERASHTEWDQIGAVSSAVRGAGNVVWYPISMDAANLSESNSLFEGQAVWKSREADADMRIIITQSVSEGRQPKALICNTTSPPASEARTNVMDCSRTPVGMDAPTFALGDYDILNHGVLEVAYRSEHKANAEKFAEAGDAVTPFITEWFGTPHEEVRIVELFDPGASPYESGRLLLTPFGNADSNLLQVALVHELTHSALVSRRAWISEGLAHFGQALYRERQQNREAALDFLDSQREPIVVAQRAITDRSKEQNSKDESLIATAIDEFYRSKAAYVWWMLRDMVGDEALKKALASYHDEQDKESAYLQHLLEAQSKRNLQWFFDDWVYHDRGLADFRVESAFARKASQDNYLVTVTIENLGSAGAEVPVKVQFDGGDMSQRVEVRGKGNATVRVAVPKLPKQIVVNDGSVPESDLSNNSFKVPTTAQ